jgi:integrase
MSHLPPYVACLATDVTQGSDRHHRREPFILNAKGDPYRSIFAKFARVAAIILSARQMPPPYGRIVEFLALTGQRREEVAQLEWDELDEKSRTWTIPGSRTKNKKAHIVHLSEPA